MTDIGTWRIITYEHHYDRFRNQTILIQETATLTHYEFIIWRTEFDYPKRQTWQTLHFSSSKERSDHRWPATAPNNQKTGYDRQVDSLLSYPAYSYFLITWFRNLSLYITPIKFQIRFIRIVIAFSLYSSSCHKLICQSKPQSSQYWQS